ncbi:MAG: response regulator transcription factor [Elusimicrobia bacterium]|nr:response regulator transcription factor [Elusimicrobiota bacterium]
MPTKILIVDDDRAILKTLKRYLEDRSLTAITTDNGSEALLLAKESKPDLILTDAEMPGLEGYALCRVLRKQQTTQTIPIVIMSGKMIQEKDVLAGFDGGADDYITKPFSYPVLLARIHAVLKRYQTADRMSEKLKRQGLELDPASRTVTIRKKPVSLTRKEFDLLATLLSKPGRVLGTSYLLETVWGYDPADYNDPGTVEVHISHLRKKLGPKFGKQIVAVTGHGYKLNV